MSVLDEVGMSASRAPALPRRAIAKRILVVEDESMIAMVMADQVAELGYTAVGPVCTIAEARHLAEIATIDAALLDMSLNGVLSHEVADILSRRNIPFMFITGYNEPPVGPYKDVAVLNKPFQLIDLMNAIEGVVAKPPDAGHITAAQRR